jgi:hypothetical protein
MIMMIRYNDYSYELRGGYVRVVKSLYEGIGCYELRGGYVRVVNLNFSYGFSKHHM